MSVLVIHNAMAKHFFENSHPTQVETLKYLSKHWSQFMKWHLNFKRILCFQSRMYKQLKSDEAAIELLNK